MNKGSGDNSRNTSGVTSEGLCAALSGNTPFDRHIGFPVDCEGGGRSCAAPVRETPTDKNLIVDRKFEVVR